MQTCESHVPLFCLIKTHKNQQQQQQQQQQKVTNKKS